MKAKTTSITLANSFSENSIFILLNFWRLRLISDISGSRIYTQMLSEPTHLKSPSVVMNSKRCANLNTAHLLPSFCQFFMEYTALQTPPFFVWAAWRAVSPCSCRKQYTPDKYSCRLPPASGSMCFWVSSRSPTDDMDRHCRQAWQVTIIQTPALS